MSRHEYAVLMATTLDRLLFGARPYWGPEPGAIHVTAIRAPIDRPFRSLIPLLRGRPGPRMLQNGYVSHNADCVRMAFEGSFVLDGQDYQARRTQPITLSEGGRALFLSC
jgi:diacylglycerol kinase (ATP)